MDKEYYFYVLYCQDNTLYAGYTTDLLHRLHVHNQGKGAKYTRVKSRRPVSIIYAERHCSRSQAMRAEAKFKQLSRYQKEEYLHQHEVKSIGRSSLVIRQAQQPAKEESHADTE